VVEGGDRLLISKAGRQLSSEEEEAKGEGP